MLVNVASFGCPYCCPHSWNIQFIEWLKKKNDARPTTAYRQ
ncbi:MAG: hypothetical protein OJF50_004195 [Nitrospira sp.]|nr:hypothetical protein [Nitrospira sp.]